ncbi:nucleoside 2-deoxyribosyltransferase [Marinomonas mediterranea]|uniref:Nucleoside 2-deoxyribosyltransferase n=1 Tax=Marinomonas mediterranea (strain ATCC 700492 / JCM 21426 / NBRC 103028 / MMB-1) TaxID=717774 RepID=F2JYK5_MARM1|nr:nucleoside 2-deoxyribosyltransferase [Marinomonas mediterranea]ADZ93134.1 nucleoside 2-deoxyribosyltransferase [Marinomonas mediterranea MMB-1]WCN15099.1 nucleoside 2-deoxyribosyltransferase [Marinomonas mediterranea]WCN19142.1 nucleoside 2-deoxyribosyltransferase [Marinomonas mediterranea MMB-1]
MQTIYLAGPEVFLPNAEEIGENKKSLCKKYGFIGLFPLDKVITPQKTPIETALAISEGNELLVERSDIVLANLTPFRGTSADAGTIYELGLGRGLRKQLAAYSNTTTPFLERVWRDYGQGSIEQAPKGDIRDRLNHKIEEFGLIDNLMLEGGIHLANGLFLAGDVNNAYLYSDLSVFEALLKKLAEQAL